MPLFGGAKVLTREQMYDIHLAALRVIVEVGLEVYVSKDALAQLRQRGVKVDESSRRVWVDAEDVLETIRQFSGARSTRVTVDGVDKNPLPHVLPARVRPGIGAHHGFVYDEHHGLRPARREDLFNCLRLKKHLPDEPAQGAGMLYQHVPGEVQFVHATAFNVKYCQRARATDCNGPGDGAWIARIMQAAGLWDETQTHLGSMYARSPLCLIGRGAEFLELRARQGRPGRVSGMPTAAATAPGTVAGYVVQYLAECFGFTTVGRLLAGPPNDALAPTGHGDDITAMDVRLGIFSNAGPEISLMRMAMKQILGEFYKLPGGHCCGIRTFTDAKKPGIQAAMEKTFQAMADVMVGMYSDEPAPVVGLDCLGSLNLNLCLSLEQAVIDYEFCQCLNRLLAGIRADEDSLGFDSIRRVGPSGEFLSDEHTARHSRTEWWFPRLLHRGAWDAWRAAGAPDVMTYAREIVAESGKLDVPCVLADDVAREVDRLVQAAERELLGSTTGVLP